MVDLAGETAGEMVVGRRRRPIRHFHHHAGFGGGFPNSLMGVMAYIRQVYLDADHYQQAKQFYAAHSRGTPRPEYDRALGRRAGIAASPAARHPPHRCRSSAALRQRAACRGVAIRASGRLSVGRSAEERRRNRAGQLEVAGEGQGFGSRRAGQHARAANSRPRAVHSSGAGAEAASGSLFIRAASTSAPIFSKP